MNFFKNKKLFSEEHQKHFFITSALVLLFFCIFFRFNSSSLQSSLGKKTLKQSKEIIAIKKTIGIAEQAKIYESLILRVGPENAQDELFHSGLPFTGETHLLNHVVGDFLYKKYGPSGLVYCRDYFLSSCYHGFILHAIADGGMPLVAKTFEECLKFGNTVSSQCAHGMGHGFLANGGYKNLIGALKTCDEAASTMEGFPSYNCYDGVFMENIWAVHDGKPSPDRWVKESDPFYPCDDKRIDSKYIRGCWSNQPSLAYQLFRGDLRKVAMDVCNKVADSENKETCFNGLSRQIHPLTQGSSKKTFELCSVMPNESWKNYCIITNVSASYSVGDREVPFQICSEMETSAKSSCYNQLPSTMRVYKKPSDNFTALCKKITDQVYKKECEKINNP